MKSIYQTIWVEMPYEAVQITEVTVRQAFNSHACLRLAAVVAQEGRDGAMELAAERETVRAGFLGAEGQAPFSADGSRRRSGMKRKDRRCCR